MPTLKILGSSSLRNHQLPIASHHLGVELHQPLLIHGEIFFSDLILSTRIQLYQFMCTEEHGDVRQTPCGCRHPLSPLGLLAPSSAIPPEPWRQRCDRHVLFRAEHSTVSSSLRVSQLWVSVFLATLLQIEAFPMRTKRCADLWV